MVDKGYIPLSRKFFESPYWKQERTFSLSEAWLDLIQMARFSEKPGEITLSGGHRISIRRGEVRASLRYLSKRWGWGVAKTRRFIDQQIEAHALQRRTEQGESLIKLCNYGLYNPLAENIPHTDRTPTNTPTDTKKKKEK